MKKSLHSLISFFIVIVVAVLVFGVAGTIVWINVANSHSNYRVIKNEIADHHLYEQFQQRVMAAAPNQTEKEDEVSSSREMQEQPDPSRSKAHALVCQELAQRDSTTLYSYLESSGRSKSFSTRQFLAEKYNIVSYTGSSLQNQQLLKALKADDLQTAECVQ